MENEEVTEFTPEELKELSRRFAKLFLQECARAKRQNGLTQIVHRMQQECANVASVLEERQHQENATLL